VKSVYLDKAKLHNAEVTKEMVEATNEGGQAKNECRMLREKLKRA